jgi:DNA-binding beta-propeller fold protein YncE
VLPDGRRAAPAGSEWIFDEPDYKGGLTSALVLVPGTTWAITVDTGDGEHAVRCVDTAMVGVGDPVVGRVKFEKETTLNSGVVVVPPKRVFVATGNGVVQALTLGDNGELTRDDARSVALPPSTDSSGKSSPWYASSLAASPDGARLLVGGVTEPRLLTYDIDEASPTYGEKRGEVDLGSPDVFGLYFDPNDPAGKLAYATMWSNARVVEIDLSAPDAPVAARSFPTDRDPEGMAFLDARWAVVANALGDTLGLIDRVSGGVTPIKVELLPNAHGLEPAGLAYDPAAKRLYAALAGLNAVAAYDVDLAQDPPVLSAAGKLAASWWPGGVAVRPDGAVVVASMRGHGSGPTLDAFPLGDNDISDRMRGGLQVVPAPSGADLAAGEQVVAKAIAVGALPGYPQVSCPPGVMDFPVPAETGGKPSDAIKHVFFILRENKDFDGIFGDLEGVDGKPELTLKPHDEMEVIWQNLRALARGFTVADNYYTDAVYSTQGHVWSTYGRSSDFNERTWTNSRGGRPGRAVPGGGVVTAGQPIEGSLFDWLGENGVEYDVLGEIVGSPKKSSATHPVTDVLYPGGPFQNIKFNDLQKACYTAGRARVACNLGSFTYMTLPNDHTFGVSPKNATPEVVCAVNDEATGMIIDAITHSPMWASSLIIVTEDDPSQGGEHIDSHRAPLVMISPWIKRNYVTKTHIDVASIHKLFAHILALPYPNISVASAGLPLDAFTATPDYTPYTYLPRARPLACGDGATAAESKLTDSWDLDEPDEQPGLDAQVTRWMHGKQLEVLPPSIERAVQARLRERAERGRGDGAEHAEKAGPLP